MGQRRFGMEMFTELVVVKERKIEFQPRFEPGSIDC